MERDVDTSATKMGKSLSTLAKVGIGAAIGGGLFAFTGALRASFREMQNAQKVAAQTNAVIKSTGGVAGVAAQDIDRLADSLLRKTGIDDEAIKSGANLLLTFTNIRNVAGQGNDIFNQSTRILLDMSTALGEDATSSAIRLGKALQDPILGVTALRRVGVAFDASQKEQIKSMVEAGNVMGAQKLILAELTREFGGSAEAAGKTLPGQLNILRETLLNTGAEILTGLTPAITQLVAKLLVWTRQLQANKKLQQDVKDAVEGGVDAIRTTVDVVQEVVGVMGGWKNASQFIIAGTLYAQVLKLSKAFTVLAGTEAAAGTAGAAAGGAGIAGAAGNAARLLGTLRAISAIGTIVVAFKIKSEGWDAIPEWLIPPGTFGRPGGRFGGNAGQPSGPVGPPGGPMARGNVRLSPGADRPGVHTKQIVLDFVSAISGQLGGQRLVIGTGTSHSKMTSSGNVSQHWSGNAADIPASGAALTRLGQAALIAAGANPSWARRQKGGLYNIGGFQIIFNSMIGGNHFNHLHVGVRDGTEIPGSGRGTEVTGPVSQPTATPPGGPPRGATSGGGVVPQSLELALAQAEVTKGTADDLKALRNIEAYIEKRLATEKKVAERLKLLRELKSVRSQIASITGGTPGRARQGLADLIPAGLEHGLAKAELTKTLDDDLKALQQIEAYLVKRLAATKKLTEQTRIMRELKDVRAQMEGILGSIGADKKAIDKLIGDIIAGTDTLVSGPREGRAAGAFAPGTDFQAQITTPEGQAELTKILANLEPQKQRIRDWAKEMDLKRKAALERKKTLQAQLKKMDKTPARLRTVAWRTARANIVAAIAQLTETIKQLDEGINRAFEMWSEIEATETSEVQRVAGEEGDRSQRPEGGGGGGGGDLGDVGGGGGAAEPGRSAADIQAEIDRNVTGYLGAQRDLVRSYSSNVLAAAFAGEMGAGAGMFPGGGGSITVTNIFPTPPPDPHAFTKQLEFELKALGA